MSASGNTLNLDRIPNVYKTSGAGMPLTVLQAVVIRNYHIICRDPVQHLSLCLESGEASAPELPHRDFSDVVRPSLAGLSPHGWRNRLSHEQVSRKPLDSLLDLTQEPRGAHTVHQPVIKGQDEVRDACPLNGSV